MKRKKQIEGEIATQNFEFIHTDKLSWRKWEIICCLHAAHNVDILTLLLFTVTSTFQHPTVIISFILQSDWTYGADRQPEHFITLLSLAKGIKENTRSESDFWQLFLLYKMNNITPLDSTLIHPKYIIRAVLVCAPITQMISLSESHSDNPKAVICRIVSQQCDGLYLQLVPWTVTDWHSSPVKPSALAFHLLFNYTM